MDKALEGPATPDLPLFLTIYETDPTRNLAAKWAAESDRFLDILF